MRVFDDVERTYHGVASHSETTYSFWNRSARPAAGRIRGFIESWLDDFPREHRAELARRFRVDDFQSAFHELVVYALLRRHAAEVEIHPNDVASGSGRPDFVASFSDGRRVVFEAVVVKDSSRAEQATTAEWDRVLDQINGITSDFFINFGPRPTFGSPPTSRKVTAFLERQVGVLDVQTVAKQIEANPSAPLPGCEYREIRNGCHIRIEFQFLPRSERCRGTNKSIGISPSDARWGGAGSALQSSIVNKATRYGKLNCPYVIIVNCVSQWSFDHQDVMEALFGRKVRLSTDRRPCGFGQLDKSSGAFVRPGGRPQLTRVSGVAVGLAVPMNLGNARFKLYHNPSAQKSAVQVPWRLDCVMPYERYSDISRGEGVGEVLDLPSDWPGELFE